MYKASLNIGTLAGIAGFAIFMGCYAMGISPIFFGKFLGSWVPVGAVIWANIEVRNKALGGKMTYTQAFLSGMLTIFIWASFKGFCIYLFMTLTDQHLIEQFVKSVDSYYYFFEKIAGQPADGKPDLDSIVKELTPWNTMMNDINGNCLYGMVLCFIISFVTKRIPKR